jgi:hypothetical protein
MHSAGIALAGLTAEPCPHEEDSMADDRERQNTEENDEIGRAAEEDINAAADDDEFEEDDLDEEDEEVDDVEEGE